MNARARVLAILNRRPVDRIPVDIWYTPEVWRSLADHFQTEDEIELHRRMELDKIAVISAEHPIPEGRNLWGTKIRTVDAGAAAYQETQRPGLADYPTIASLDDYPHWPDPRKYDYVKMTERAQSMSAHFATMGPWVSFFEIYCTLRGLEQALMDLVLDEAYVDAVLDRIEDVQTRMLTEFYDRAAPFIDLAFVSDDMGSQNGLLISPDMWDRFIKDRMHRLCELIHSYDITILYHSDGACEPLLERLIDAGIDVLNPIQHVCPGMDMTELKDKYGDRLIFHGGVDTQDVLPFGDPDKVRQETRNCLDTLGRGKQGYICCSCHNVQAGSPVENILAMIDTVTNSA